MFRTALTAAAALVLALPALGSAQTVDELVARNVAARGGAEAWGAISSLRLTGRMGLGRGLLVPYVLELQRPKKMRFEFVFDGQTAVQTSDGKTGWKLAPFRGRTTPEPLTEAELRETADTADLYGLLFGYAARGHVVELQGKTAVQGKDAYKLKVTLPAGAVRWVYLDAETGLEIKVEALRKLRGRDRVVETYFHDWKETGGLLIARRQETRTEGIKKSHLLTVTSVRINPVLDESRFGKPAALAPKTAAVTTVAPKGAAHVR